MLSTEPRAKVALIPVDDYSPTKVKTAMQEGMDLLGIPSQPFAGQRLLIKPNLLTASTPEQAVCTHPEVVGAVIDTLGRGAREVWVGDSPGIGSGVKVAARLGLTEVCASRGAQLLDLTEPEEAACPKGAVVKRLPISRRVLAADAVVTCAKLKTHGLTGYTGAVKNLYGCIPGTFKAQLHLRFREIEDFSGMLVDLYQRISPQLAVIDGIVAMEGPGPRNGQPKKLGALIVSRDGVAADAVACQLIGVDPLSIVPLRLAEERGVGRANPKFIDVVGASISQLKQDDFQTVSGTHTSIRGLPPLLHRWLQAYAFAQPVVEPELCQSCRICERHCPPGAITMKDVAVIDYQSCIRCYCCQELCPHAAITLQRGWLNRLLSRWHR